MLLAIETSCDDSAVALLDMQGNVLTNQISSQTELHEKYGGIVPEIASRKHLTTLPLLLRHVFDEHNLTLADLKAVAVTYSPGLIGSLLVGVSYAKSLAWQAGVPLIPIDHLEGHLLAPFLDHPDLDYPFLGLIASGGHTHLISAKGLGNYRLLGKTIDDAAGEAYDKVAKMLGFQYPGGPIIESLANQAEKPTIDFPIPLKGKKSLNFSFSGLKTAVRNEAIARKVFIEKKQLISLEYFNKHVVSERKDQVQNIAASFQTIVETIIEQRFAEALKRFRNKRIVLTGGVASNKGIRERLQKLADRKQITFYFPSGKHCTDNAAMIGYAALQYFNTKDFKPELHLKLNASSRSPISQMQVNL